MMQSRVTSIPAQRVQSLVWNGDELVDWVAGGHRYRLDGTMVPRHVAYSYRFDAACSSPSGKYAVIYERLGTKGLVLKDGQILREIDRSFYHADVYEFPVAVTRLPSGREVLIHCPNDYNQLEIDDVETGERLTKRDGAKPPDFFHSPLAINRAGTMLLSAGWIWHPFDTVAAYDLEKVKADPGVLDLPAALQSSSTEISSAAFIGDRRMVVSTSDETFDDEEDPNSLQPNTLAILDLDSGALLSQVKVTERPGTLMSLGDRYIVGFYEHPKVFDLATGEVMLRLPDLATGKQTSSIIHHIDPPPVMALDPSHRRFAVVTAKEIQVIEFHG